MQRQKIYDPFHGMETDLLFFDDDTFWFQSSNGQQYKGKMTNDYVCFPIEATQNETISANEAAEMLNVSKMRITQLCQMGKLHSSFVGTSLRISKADVEKYKAEREIQ